MHKDCKFDHLPRIYPHCTLHNWSLRVDYPEVDIFLESKYTSYDHLTLYYQSGKWCTGMTQLNEQMYFLCRNYNLVMWSNLIENNRHYKCMKMNQMTRNFHLDMKYILWRQN